MPKRIVLGISGASGVIYGARIVSLLKETDYETHLVITEAGKINLGIETDCKLIELEEMADVTYDNRDIGAAIASGSFLTEGMIVAPCSIKSLSAIANSYNDNLLIRAADVTLKEKRKLVLMVRETPLHVGHLRLMTMATEMGAQILPPVPAFYHHPKTIMDIVDQTVGKVFDCIGIKHDLFMRWGEDSMPQ